MKRDPIIALIAREERAWNDFAAAENRLERLKKKHGDALNLFAECPLDEINDFPSAEFEQFHSVQAVEKWAGWLRCELRRRNKSPIKTWKPRDNIAFRRLPQVVQKLTAAVRQQRKSATALRRRTNYDRALKDCQRTSHALADTRSKIGMTQPATPEGYRALQKYIKARAKQSCAIITEGPGENFDGEELVALIRNLTGASKFKGAK